MSRKEAATRLLRSAAGCQRGTPDLSALRRAPGAAPGTPAAWASPAAAEGAPAAAAAPGLALAPAPAGPRGAERPDAQVGSSHARALAASLCRPRELPLSPAAAGARPPAGASRAGWSGSLGPGRSALVPGASAALMEVQCSHGRGRSMATAAGREGQQQSGKDIHSADLVVQPALQPKAPSQDLSGLRFGAQFSQHMLKIAWSRAHGWGAPLIAPLEPIPLHPAAQVLHYGMSCFEGMKAYKAADGSIRLFRPDKNMDRLLSSCQRLNLPAFDKSELLECIKALLRVESAWIPQRDGFSIYLRPFAMATTPFLGVGPPSDALLACVLSPAGPYFPDGLRPISLLVDTAHVRAAPGGVGDRKLAGNYAPTILPQVEAAAKGCSQVLYVLQERHIGPSGRWEAVESDADPEDGWVGESGAMNVFFLLRKEAPPPSSSSSLPGEGAGPGPGAGKASWDDRLELVTPPLDGLILPGVTRDSVLELVRGWGPNIEVSERPIRLRELTHAHKEGRLVEIFGTGTAVIVQPISSLVLNSGETVSVPVDEGACAFWTGLNSSRRELAHAKELASGTPFSLTGRVYRAILNIQYGHVEHPWSEVV